MSASERLYRNEKRYSRRSGRYRSASPAGCDEARREELGPRLDALEDDGSPRIVNGWLLTRGERGEGMWYHVGTAATQLFAPEGWF